MNWYSKLNRKLDKFVDLLLCNVSVVKNLDNLTDRQLSNFLHGRDKDDDGEFTTSAMGAAEEVQIYHGPLNSKPQPSVEKPLPELPFKEGDVVYHRADPYMFYPMVVEHIWQYKGPYAGQGTDQVKVRVSWFDATIKLNELVMSPEMLVSAPQFRHKKRGSHYKLIGHGQMQTDDWVWKGGDNVPVDNIEVTVYRAEDGSLWVRPKYEFEDGRFEAI